MGNLLGWDAARIDAEIETYRRHVQDVKAFATSAAPLAEARVAHG
jgi:hypothetical protein